MRSNDFGVRTIQIHAHKITVHTPCVRYFTKPAMNP